jgi:hypothetical protein
MSLTIAAEIGRNERKYLSFKYSRISERAMLCLKALRMRPAVLLPRVACR